MVFVLPFQELIAKKRVCGKGGPLPGFGLDMPYKFFDAYRLTDFGVYTGFLLYESKDNTSLGGRSAWLPPPSSAEVEIVHLNRALQFSTFQRSQMEPGVPYSLKDLGDPFAIDTQIQSQPIGGMELIKSLKDGQISAQPFALPAEQPFHVYTAGVKNLKKTHNTHTIVTPLKVGRTTKDYNSSSIPAPVLGDTGYETF